METMPTRSPITVQLVVSVALTFPPIVHSVDLEGHRLQSSLNSGCREWQSTSDYLQNRYNVICSRKHWTAPQVILNEREKEKKRKYHWHMHVYSQKYTKTTSYYTHLYMYMYMYLYVHIYTPSFT